MITTVLLGIALLVQTAWVAWDHSQREAAGETPQAKVSQHFPLHQGRSWRFARVGKPEKWFLQTRQVARSNGRPVGIFDLKEQDRLVASLYIGQEPDRVALLGLETPSTRQRFYLPIALFPTPVAWDSGVDAVLNCNFRLISEQCARNVPCGSFACLHIVGKLDNGVQFQTWTYPRQGLTEFVLEGDVKQIGLAEPIHLQLEATTF